MTELYESRLWEGTEAGELHSVSIGLYTVLEAIGLRVGNIAAPMCS